MGADYKSSLYVKDIADEGAHGGCLTHTDASTPGNIRSAIVRSTESLHDWRIIDGPTARKYWYCTRCRRLAAVSW